MRCHEARGHLSGDQEPVEAVLEALFEHVDACPSCQEFDESRLVPRALAALSPEGNSERKVGADFYAGVTTRLGERQEENLQLLDAPHTEEPSPAALETLFAQVDADPRLQQELAPTPRALSALRASLSPVLSGLTERVLATTAPCSESRRFLAARAEPMPALASQGFGHIDACESCAKVEETLVHPALLSWKSAVDSEELFQGFYEGVHARLPLRVGPRRFFAWNAVRTQALFALAAAVIVALTVWKVAGLGGPVDKPEGPSEPTIAVESVNFGHQLYNLKGFKPGIEWVETSEERSDGVERFSNEATLPGRDVEYSLPRSSPKVRRGHKPAKKPSLKQRLKSEAKGPALSM